VDRELRRLQGCVDDLVSLLALPAVWYGRDAGHVVETLLEALCRMLRLDFAYARLNALAGRAPVEALRLAPGGPKPSAREIGTLLEQWFTPSRPTSTSTIPNPMGDGELSVVQSWLGFEKGAGVVIAASDRSDFPSEIETLLLSMAVNQAVIELQRAQVLSEHNRAEEVHRQRQHVQAENLYLKQELDSEQHWGEIVGQGEALRRTLKLVEQVAPTNACVLIQGETGTGKELIARAIHRLSDRNGAAFVKLNCAAVPTGLLESELFGHERGAFTGAIAQRVGRFDLAHRGTLFLDEVGEIPLELQAKLLRVLQEHEFERLGSTRTIRVDVRLIAASNRNLARMVTEHTFRDDLYYRLHVFPITVPPLRERVEDVPLLARWFCERYARRLGKPVPEIDPVTMEALCVNAWPGNVRELENFIERSIILTSGLRLEAPLTELEPLPGSVAEESTLASHEREAIVRALDACDWVIAGPKGAAARLGLKRTSLQYKMRRLGIVRATEA
jgi:formate hydrogenlyase transcriptional activator